MNVGLRPPRSDDLDFCARLYVAGMEKVIRDLRLDMTAQVTCFHEQWNADARRSMTLGFVKTNPALRLYQRLGFRITHEDERKFNMKRKVPG